MITFIKQLYGYESFLTYHLPLLCARISQLFTGFGLHYRLHKAPPLPPIAILSQMNQFILPHSVCV
jgi:hypothetical protein